MTLNTLILLYFVSIAHGFGCTRTSIENEPIGKETFDVTKYMGKWYIMYIINPCSWNGADDFTDWIVEYTLNQTTGIVHCIGNWRSNGICVTTPIRHIPVGRATIRIQDSIGGVISGKAVIVDTDYTSFVVKWGCTKYSNVSDKCDDVWVSVKTRTPTVSASLRLRVDSILQKTMGITTTNMLQMNHLNRKTVRHVYV